MSGSTGLAIGPMPTSDADIGVFETFTGIPEGATLNFVSWSTTARASRSPCVSPDPNVSDHERAPPELWIADVKTLECRPLGVRLNTLFESYSWLDPTTIAACVVPANRPRPPDRPRRRAGPRVQSNAGGNVAQARTYADLLKDAHDADLFEHFALSEFVVVDVETNVVAPFGDGEARMHTRCDPSPDGAFAILEELRRPFSYEIPCGRFPKRVWVVNRAGETVREVADLPLADEIPIVHNACREGPRSVNWRPDKPAELYWTEAQDGGDPRVEVSPRDITFTADMHGAGPDAPGVPTFPDGSALRRDQLGRRRPRAALRVLV